MVAGQPQDQRGDHAVCGAQEQAEVGGEAAGVEGGGGDGEQGHGVEGWDGEEGEEEREEGVEEGGVHLGFVVEVGARGVEG